MIRMQPYVIAALIRHFNLRRSMLSGGLFEEMHDPAYAAQIGAWHESLPADHASRTSNWRCWPHPTCLLTCAPCTEPKS